jgi:hypothetical protein
LFFLFLTSGAGMIVAQTRPETKWPGAVPPAPILITGTVDETEFITLPFCTSASRASALTLCEWHRLRQAEKIGGQSRLWFLGKGHPARPIREPVGAKLRQTDCPSQYQANADEVDGLHEALLDG